MELTAQATNSMISPFAAFPLGFLWLKAMLFLAFQMESADVEVLNCLVWWKFPALRGLCDQMQKFFDSHEWDGERWVSK